ncbi:hypothetical protein vB_PsyM_KIL3b_0153 [Pseudomonas phage vB_PsyM_KIL3b]|uniref:Uncharacterized protein n=6 Tax=Flaumdravirus TaxID=2560133 RepID=A0A142IEA3_9CAUD|nr:hypothetical protein BH774_gp051 [Pseudomonas phage vB_PsyM_KIL1]YP_009616838.1 hypothetical protein FDI83_gp052 [Pseudomonas phage vB_PsyM_KIL4]AMR57558.1 hypothetical protein vB_PsyM_KIL2_0158 [Pseudomonas phage vB_PsyM_KIL2]AMR57720.1 hypothetical protein vB_PsyM_KIL3_0153 [Pseudomonas phage vB_PsyM_KIL3]AMR58054.1 hypothetical protein vB_PsyM_KIL5_0163 [Pseudomonas phage vB_PsyM_KIL5]AMR58218.1 hypothetical protein vB_PsyM_KIL3b_0153 [Pseudomonas phage vB_PsyM_KIL3b]AMR57398.1 hypothet
MKIKIFGDVKQGCDYLTSGEVYDVLEGDENDSHVYVLDNDGDKILVITEKSEYYCSHLGPNAKAVFVD